MKPHAERRTVNRLGLLQVGLTRVLEYSRVLDFVLDFKKYSSNVLVRSAWPHGHGTNRNGQKLKYDTIRYDTRCYFNVRSQADMSQLDLPHGTNN